MLAGRTSTALVVAVLLCTVSSAVAQAPYKTVPVDPKYLDQKSTEFNQLKAAYSFKALRSNSLDQATRTALEDYLRKYLFPTMTQPASLGELSRIRLKLATDFIAIKSADVHNHAIAETERTMKAIIGDNYHPLVRVNAMYVLAQLNEVEPTLKKRGGVPHVAVLPYMIERLSDPNTPDGVKVGALVGIRRHVFSFLVGDLSTPVFPLDARIDVEATVAGLLPLVKATDPGKRSPAGHAWMRGMAIESLAAMGQVGDNQEVLNAIIAVVSEKTAPMSLRCVAAKSIGIFRFDSELKAETEDTTRGLGALAAFACQNEIDRMNKVIEKASSDSDSATPGSLQGSGGGSSGISSPGGAGGISGLGASSGGPGGSSGLSGLGGIGGGGGGSSADFTGGPSVPEHQIVGFRRRIRYQLSSIQFGLKGGGELNRGVTGLTADDKRALLDSVTKNVDELLKLTESKMDLQELLVEFQKSSRRLDVLTKKAPPVDPAADPGKLPPDAGDVPDAPSLPADAGDVPPAQPKGN